MRAIYKMSYFFMLSYFQTKILAIGVCMRMMPRAALCTNVCIAHAGGARGADELCASGSVGALRT